MAEYIERKSLLDEINSMVYTARADSDIPHQVRMVVEKIKAAPTIDKVYGYPLEDLARFAAIMRQLGVGDYDVKDFLKNTELIYETLINKLNEDLNQTLKETSGI